MIKNILDYDETDNYNSYIDAIINDIVSLKIQKDDNEDILKAKRKKLYLLSLKKHKTIGEQYFDNMYNAYTAENKE